MTMGTGKDAHSNNIDVFLQCCFSNLLRRLTKAGIDDLEASVTQGTGNNLSTAIVTIKARFCN